MKKVVHIIVFHEMFNKKVAFKFILAIQMSAFKPRSVPTLKSKFPYIGTDFDSFVNYKPITGEN